MAEPGTVYDYVIVGAGSAGCVLAARLSEDAGASVLVIEAGGTDDHDAVKIPAAFPQNFRTARDWAFDTVEQKHLGSRRLYWPRGKLLGGSSSINAMIYMRGNRLDYDRWRDEFGARGWAYADLLPYFLRAEDNAWGASTYHASGGPLRVEDLRYRSATVEAFIETAVAAGFPANLDFNGEGQDGAGFFQVTQKRGRRWSAADGYLRPAAARPNVEVRTDVLVTRIEIRAGVARGVHIVGADGRESLVRADRELIVAAGAVGSPHLLLRSGIGPAHHLRERDVEVIHDLSGVGENLHDHPAVPLVWHVRDTTSLHDHENIRQLLRWQVRGSGPLTSNVGEGGLFCRSTPELNAPDLQFHVAGAAFVDGGLGEPRAAGMTVAPVLVDVHSRGRLRLRTKDPRHAPHIDPAYLDDSRDAAALIRGVEIAQDLASRAPLTRYVDRAFDPIGPLVTDEQRRAFIDRTLQTLYHPVGTCRMGSDDEAVVDTELRVRGIERLRVVDASVMPVVPRGNTNAPTIALAERAADVIRGRTLLTPYEPLLVEQVAAHA